MNYGSQRRRQRSNGTRNCVNSQGKARKVRKAQRVQKAQAWQRKEVMRNAASQTRKKKKRMMMKMMKMKSSAKVNHPKYTTLSEEATLPKFSFLPNIYKPNSGKERSGEDEWRVQPRRQALPSLPKQHPIPLKESLSILCLPRAVVAQHLPFLLVLQNETTTSLLRELSYATIKSLFV